MRNRNNPLKNIPPNAFTIIQASHEDLLKYLYNIPVRYPNGLITYINNHNFVPLIRFVEGYESKFLHLEIHSLEELLKNIESDESGILFIEYKLIWFGVDNPDSILRFNEVCRKRAKKTGPVVVITAIMDRNLLKLEGKADFFFQLGKIELHGRSKSVREQTYLDELPEGVIRTGRKGDVYGQMKLF
jgi:hypothetical protein